MALAPIPPTPEALAALVCELNQLEGRGRLLLTLELGTMLIDALYEGDVSLWRESRGRDAGFRKLAGHPELMVSAAELSRSIAIVELHGRLDVATSKHLLKSHYQEVLGLRPSQQELLLRRAHRQRWSVRRLRSEARRFRARTKLKRTGRPPKPRFQRSIDTLAKLVEVDDGLFEGIDLQSMSAPARADLHRLVRRLLHDLEHLRAALDHRTEGENLFEGSLGSNGRWPPPAPTHNSPVRIL